jgi:hypothetical protein
MDGFFYEQIEIASKKCSKPCLGKSNIGKKLKNVKKEKLFGCNKKMK